MRTTGSVAVDNYLPPPPLKELYAWCINQVPDRPGREETCSKYVRYLEKLEWPLRLSKLQTMRLNSWQVLSIRAYLRFLEERGYNVDQWKKLSVLKKKKSGSRKRVIKDEEVVQALKTLSSPQLRRYYIIYLVILYSGLRLEHTVRLLSQWNALSKDYEEIEGDCIRIPLPWISGPKRSFYAYMPRWLYDRIEQFKTDRRNVSTIAYRKKILAPSLLRKYALNIMSRLFGPQVAAHIAGHAQGIELFPALVKDETLEKHYISIEDIAALEYHRYPRVIQEIIGQKAIQYA